MITQSSPNVMRTTWYVSCTCTAYTGGLARLMDGGCCPWSVNDTNDTRSVPASLCGWWWWHYHPAPHVRVVHHSRRTTKPGCWRNERHWQHPYPNVPSSRSLFLATRSSTPTIRFPFPFAATLSLPARYSKICLTTRTGIPYRREVHNTAQEEEDCTVSSIDFYCHYSIWFVILDDCFRYLFDRFVSFSPYVWPPGVNDDNDDDDDDDDGDDGATEVQTNFCFFTIFHHNHHKI